MDLHFQYDENLSENEFFKKLQSEHKIFIDTAPLENWIFCIPRNTTIRQDHLVDPNFLLAHILIPNDELPKSHFTNLLGQDIHLENQKLVNNKRLEAIILFEEVFYTKTLMKYKVWCLDCPMYGDHSTGTNGIFIVRDLRDAIDLIWNETSQSKVIFRKIDKACTTFIRQHKKSQTLDKLRSSIHLLYGHCLQILMYNKRITEKSRQDAHFYRILKIALETYMTSNLYHFVFDAIAVNTLDDSEQFNKKMRNLSQVHLSYFGIDQKCSDLVTSARTELLKIENYSTAVEKLACLRRSLNATSRHSSRNICVDELISILVFIIIKSGLTHWIATLKFLKDFILNDLPELSDKGADSFLVSTLEAAIFYIKTLNLSKRPIDDAIPLLEQQNTFTSKADFVDHLFNQIRAGNEPQVLRLLSADNDVEIKTTFCGKAQSTLCHPLCDCEKCAVINDEIPNVNVTNHNGITPLHVASMNGSPKMINLLLALGADLAATDENNWTALHYAAARGHQNVLLLLLHAGTEINAETIDKNTPLHLSCLNGHQGCVKALLYYSDHMKVKIEKNSQNKMGDTPLHMAATWGFVEIIDTLLEYGVKIDRRNRFGQTASDYAHNSLITHQLQSTFLIIDDDFDVYTNCESQTMKPEPFRGHIDKNAFKSTAQLHKKTNNDKIIAAIRNGDKKLAYYFLGLNFQNDGSSEPCHPLCTCEICQRPKDTTEKEYRNQNVVDVNDSNSEGVTLMHAAAQVGDVNLMEYLLTQGASINQKTFKNETVLHYGVRSQCVDVVEFILSKIKKETLNCTNDDGNTALHLALRNGSSQIVDYILRSKSELNSNAQLFEETNSADDDTLPC